MYAQAPTSSPESGSTDMVFDCVPGHKMTRTAATYWSWTWAFNHHPALCTFLQTIPSLTLPERKDILGLCRSQTPVVKGSHIEQMLNCLTKTIIVVLSPCKHQHEVAYTEMTFRHFVHLFQPLLLDHLTAAIIASAVRISPGISKTEFQEVLGRSINKEISAAITIADSATFDFRCILDDRYRYRLTSLTDRMLPNPEVACDTHARLSAFRTSIQGSTLFPTLGSKTVGRQVEEQFWRTYQATNATFMHNGDMDLDSCNSDPLLPVVS